MTRIIKLLILLIFLSPADPGSLLAQEQWKFISNDSGVTIYSRTVAGHEESEFKGIVSINQPIGVIGAVLADIPAYTEWFFRCSEARKIAQISSTGYHFLIYIALDTPWPLWPRDVVYDVNIKIDPPSNKVEVRAKAVADPVVPHQKDHVRIIDSKLHWILEKIDRHQTRMIFSMRTDAGGSAGSYLSDLGCRKTIYHSLINLHEFAANPKYESVGRKMSREYAPND
jgi:hypothetical protein